MKGLTRLDECIVRRLAKAPDGLPYDAIEGVAIGLLASSEAHFRIADAMAGSLKALRMMGLIIEEADHVCLTAAGRRVAGEIGPGDFGTFFAGDGGSFHPRRKAAEDRGAATTNTEAPERPRFSLAAFLAALRRIWRSM